MKNFLSVEKLNEMLENKEFLALREMLEEENVADIAMLFEELENDLKVRVFRLMTKDKSAEVFAFLDIDSQKDLITRLALNEAGELIDNLFADDATDLIEEMPAGVVKKILKNTTKETRRDINRLLNYPDSSAGSIMTVEYVDLKKNLTVKQALQRVRQIGVDKETLNVLYVLDSSRRLLGHVSLRNLILANEDDTIEDIMWEKPAFVTTLEDREEVARLFKKYDLLALPVVDSEQRMVGIITVDDVVDIIEKEATEDIEVMAAITPDERPYIKLSVLEIFKNRILWLLILMISSTFTGLIMASFEDKLKTLVVLTAFIPMLMGTGGNSGSQASVSIIRALSLGEVSFKDTFKVMFKELRVSILCAITLAAANFGKMYLIDRLLMNNDAVTLSVITVVSLTLLVTVIIAKLVGAILPMIAKKLGLDPAVMASPFITTIVDALSLVVYFSIASAFIL